MTAEDANIQMPAGAIPHRPADVATVFGGVAVFPYATVADGSLAGWRVSGSCPHELVCGTTGAGTSTSNRVVAIEAARQGADVRLIDPTGQAFRGLRGWPNVTAVAAAGPDIAAVIAGACDDMNRRFEAVETGQVGFAELHRAARRIVLIVDAYPLLANFWARISLARPGRVDAPAPAALAPVLADLSALINLGRPARINIRLAGDATAPFVAGRDIGNFGSRTTFGRPSRQTAQALFGDADAGRDIPPGAVAVGTILGPRGPVRATMHWLPDPAGWADLPRADRQLLVDMLPPGTTWGGPPPGQPHPAGAGPAA